MKTKPSTIATSNQSHMAKHREMVDAPTPMDCVGEV
jgi:hypothetical protein